MTTTMSTTLSMMMMLMTMIMMLMMMMMMMMMMMIPAAASGVPLPLQRHGRHLHPGLQALADRAHPGQRLQGVLPRVPQRPGRPQEAALRLSVHAVRDGMGYHQYQ
jgi:hypothetical protein